MYIAIIDGPNLGDIGHREPSVYGSMPTPTYIAQLRERHPSLQIDYFQSNYEGAIIDRLYQAETQGARGIVLNAAAYTHTSIAILDAIRAVDTPVIEVHISNIHAREAYRHHSVIAEACRGVITGFGLESYGLAIDALLRL